MANYIPELASADPDCFGICLATVDGYVYEVGDARESFTVQSISKPFVYGLALEDRGKAAVLARIGVEPTGDAFNQISLEPDTGRPRNPMINAGAIAAAGLVAGHSQADRWSRVLSLFELYAGRRLALNAAVYQSERATGHRNRAISHMLRNAGILTDDPEPDLDLYFRQCSIDITARDLAIMAATLACGGVNPVTRERALAPHYVDEVLSVMATCGMYDYAGEWFYRVGFPAKSGVSGGILAVLPGQFGIGVFSPPLDARGNSVRGVAVCAALSEELDLHSLRAPRIAQVALRARATLVQARSKRVRSPSDADHLDAVGHRAVIYQLQGELGFAALEHIARKLDTEDASIQLVVLDLTQVGEGEIDRAALGLLNKLIAIRTALDNAVVLVGLQRHSRLRRQLDEARAAQGSIRFTALTDLDAAIEFCESYLLRDSPTALDTEEMPLACHPFLRGLAPAQFAQLEPLLQRRAYRPQEIVVHEGDPADALLLIVHGQLSVLREDRTGAPQRLATLAPGMSFGEPALLESTVRSATVRADQFCVCWSLPNRAMAALREDNPSLALALLDSALRGVWQIVDRHSGESVGQTL